MVGGSYNASFRICVDPSISKYSIETVYSIMNDMINNRVYNIPHCRITAKIDEDKKIKDYLLEDDCYFISVVFKDTEYNVGIRDYRNNQDFLIFTEDICIPVLNALTGVSVGGISYSSVRRRQFLKNDNVRKQLGGSV